MGGVIPLVRGGADRHGQVKVRRDFTGITCYSLQNHLRTSVPDIGQVETDELYVGVDKKGR